MNKKKKTEFEYDFTRASSATECTGLKPTPPLNEAENESYLNIYDYSPEVTNNPREKKVIK